MHGEYIEVDGVPKACDDTMEWGRWMQANHMHRHVGDTTIGAVRVSTVFLGLDHSWDGGPPLLYETMVFGGKFNEEQERYSTRAQAAEGHARWVKRVEGEGRPERVIVLRDGDGQ